MAPEITLIVGLCTMGTISRVGGLYLMVRTIQKHPESRQTVIRLDSWIFISLLSALSALSFISFVNGRVLMGFSIITAALAVCLVDYLLRPRSWGNYKLW